MPDWTAWLRAPPLTPLNDETVRSAAWLMLDVDDDGNQATVEILARLGRQMWVRVAEVPEGTQPDQLRRQEIQTLLSSTR